MDQMAKCPYLEQSHCPIKEDAHLNVVPLNTKHYKNSQSAGFYAKSTPQIGLPSLIILCPHSKQFFNVNRSILGSSNINLNILCLFTSVPFKSINITSSSHWKHFCHYFMFTCFFLPSFFLFKPHLCPLFCLLFPFSHLFSFCTVIRLCSGPCSSFMFISDPRLFSPHKPLIPVDSLRFFSFTFQRLLLPQ